MVERLPSMVDYNPPDASSLGNVEPYGDMAPQSPTSLVLNYLKAKGLQATSDNVRRTLEQSARDPTFMPAMRTQEPPTDTRPPSDRTKSVAANIERQPANPPPADLTKVANADELNWKPGGSPDTSAQPSGMDLTGLGQAILGGLGAGGLGALGARYLNRGPTLSVNEPGVPAGPNATGGAQAGDRYNLLPDQSAVSPMESAMQKALQPAGVPQLGSDVPDVSGIRPVVNPADVIGKPGLPPGVTATDAVNAGRGMQGVTGSSMPAPGEGNIPLRPRVSVQEIPRVPARPYVPRLLLR